MNFNPRQSFHNISIIKICKSILSGHLRYSVTALLEIHKTQIMDHQTMQVHGYCWRHTCTSFINITSSPPLHRFHRLWRHITLSFRAIKLLKPQFKFGPCCTICIILFNFSGTQKFIFLQRKTFYLQNSVFHVRSSIMVCVTKHNVDVPIMSFIKCKWGAIELQSKQEEEEIKRRKDVLDKTAP